MSFSFIWPQFSDQFHYDAIQMLNTALNKGNKPPVLADKIEVVELQMGTQPPELEIRDIGELTVDQFRGIFRLTYSGDAHIVLKTKVQANPLNHKQPDIHLISGSKGILAAKQPLVVPMLLRLSHFKLNSYVVLVVSKQKGITLVFKTDPLQNVDINSTFDSIAVIQKFIQKEIEGQLRQMFREDLPGIIHRLSQQWVKAKVEAPYLRKRPPPLSRRLPETLSPPGSLHSTPSMASVGLLPDLSLPRSAPSTRQRLSSAPSISSAPSNRRAATITTTPVPYAGEPTSSFPDLENFDPTYGLRPEGLPTKSVFGSFGSLFKPNKGLADLAEEVDDGDGEYDDEAGSFDIVDWEHGFTDDTLSTISRDVENVTEYETLPAVGGGTITLPRVYHSQSLARMPVDVGASGSRSARLQSPVSAEPVSSSRSEASSGSNRTHPATSDIQRFSELSKPSSEYFPEFLVRQPKLPAHQYNTSTLEPRPPQGNTSTSLPTPPLSDPVHPEDETLIYMKRPMSNRRMSQSSSDGFHLGSPPNISRISEQSPTIVLRPAVNNSIHQLSTLSHSNHTLSPYTRSLEHFTVRSVPPRGVGPSGLLAAERQPVKAKRKRTYRLGGKTKDTQQDVVAEATEVPLPSPGPPSEFDLSDLDHYFRSQDSLVGRSPENRTINLHRDA